MERCLAIVAVAAAGCQLIPEPPWVLTGPSILAIRSAVIGEGPNSVDLLPVPADRIRFEPLPEDTVQLEVLLADETGVRDSDDFDVRWFLCPAQGVCLSLLREAGAGLPCDDGFPLDAICSLGQGGRLEYTEPPLDPVAGALGLTQRRVAVVAGVPTVRSTDECIEELSRDPFDDLRGCLMAIRRHDLGPDLRMHELVIREDEAFDPEVSGEGFLPVQPRFAPEVVRLDFGRPEGGEPLRATPQQTTRVPANARLPLVGFGDPRDGHPPFPAIDFSTSANSFEQLPGLPRMYTTQPGVVGPGAFSLQTGDEGDTFQLIVTLGGINQAQSWATLDFVVGAP